MATETDTTLLDTGVNSGVAVNLNSTRALWSFGNFLNSVQGPGKPSTLTRNQRLAKSVLLGFDNPDYTINCQIDLDDSTSNRLTFAFLKSFCESTNTKTLVMSAFGTVVVDIVNATAEVNFPTTKGKKVTVVITFKEAQV